MFVVALCTGLGLLAGFCSASRIRAVEEGLKCSNRCRLRREASLDLAQIRLCCEHCTFTRAARAAILPKGKPVPPSAAQPAPTPSTQPCTPPSPAQNSAVQG